MNERRPVSRTLVPTKPQRRLVSVFASTVAVAVLLAGCSSGPDQVGQSAKVDPKLGVKPSPRVVAMGEKVPKGGGRPMVGKPYVVAGKKYVPRLDPDYEKVGLASWYGNAFHGRKTANGEVFDSEALTAAHPTMPLPSYARVTALDTGRSVLVRVNDRGPFHSSRLIDISRRTADVLDVRRSGVAKVKVEYVGPAPVHGDDEAFLMASYRGPGEPRPGLAETMIASAEQLPGLAADATISVASAAVGLVSGSPATAETAPSGPRIPGDVLPPQRPILAGEGYVTVAMADPADYWSGGVQLASLQAPVVPSGYTEASFTVGPQPVAEGIGPAFETMLLPPQPPMRRSYAAERVEFAYAAVDGVAAGLPLSDLASRLEAKVRLGVPGTGPVLQAGVFSDGDNALRLAAALAGIGSVAVEAVTVEGRVLSRVRVSSLAVTPEEAVAAAERAGARGARILHR